MFLILWKYLKIVACYCCWLAESYYIEKHTSPCTRNLVRANSPYLLLHPRTRRVDRKTLIQYQRTTWTTTVNFSDWLLLCIAFRRARKVFWMSSLPQIFLHQQTKQKLAKYDQRQCVQIRICLLTWEFVSHLLKTTTNLVTVTDMASFCFTLLTFVNPDRQHQY